MGQDLPCQCHHCPERMVAFSYAIKGMAYFCCLCCLFMILRFAGLLGSLETAPLCCVCAFQHSPILGPVSVATPSGPRQLPLNHFVAVQKDISQCSTSFGANAGDQGTVGNQEWCETCLLYTSDAADE